MQFANEPEIEGRQAAMQAVDDMVRKQLTTVLPALKQAVQNIEDARHTWLTHWEAGTVHLAAAIAKRLIRRELHDQPEITLDLGPRSLGVGRRQFAIAHSTESARSSIAGQSGADVGRGIIAAYRN